MANFESLDIVGGYKRFDTKSDNPTLYTEWILTKFESHT